MVVTDSQAFAVVSKIVPEDIPLTSFFDSHGALHASERGFLETAVLYELRWAHERRFASAFRMATRFSSPRAARTTGSAGILETHRKGWQSPCGSGHKRIQLRFSCRRRWD